MLSFNYVSILNEKKKNKKTKNKKRVANINLPKYMTTWPFFAEIWQNLCKKWLKICDELLLRKDNEEIKTHKGM